MHVPPALLQLRGDGNGSVRGLVFSQKIKRTKSYAYGEMNVMNHLSLKFYVRNEVSQYLQKRV